MQTLEKNLIERTILKDELLSHLKVERQQKLLKKMLAKAAAQQHATQFNQRLLEGYLSKQAERTLDMQQISQEMIPFNKNQQRYLEQLRRSL